MSSGSVARACTSFVILGAAFLGAACGNDVAPTSSTGVPIRFIVTNALAAPITIAVDGVPYVTLTSGRSTGMTVSSRARRLTWTSAKPTDSQGVPIPDDIGEVAISVASLGPALEIANVIGSETYVTAELFNLTTATVSIGVYDGASVACAAVLPAGAAPVAGYVRTGYYRLRPATEMRAYRDPGCAGAYVAWPHEALTVFEPKSGVVDLVLATAP